MLNLAEPYIKFLTIENFYNDYKKSDNLYSQNLLPVSDFRKFAKDLSYMCYLYELFISAVYRNKGIKTIFPKERFLTAKKYNLIDDADIWLSFINDYAKYHLTKDKAVKNKLVVEILENYHDKVDSIYEHTKRISLEETKDVASLDISDKELRLADNKPIYRPEELDITEKSYNIILDYFKSKNTIRNAWLHGSRYFKQNRYGADIDILLDCNPQDIKDIKKEVLLLNIPYLLDVQCVYINESFRKFVALTGNKKIYCASDFNNHWNLEKNNNSSIKFHVNLNNIISKS